MSSNAKTDQPVKVKRNFLLSALLVLVIGANAFVGLIFFLNIVGIADGAFQTMNIGMIVFSLVVCLGNIVSAIGIWKFNKWGAIGYALFVLTGFVVTGVVTKDFSNFYPLVGLCIMSILIYPYWKYMK